MESLSRNSNEKERLFSSPFPSTGTAQLCVCPIFLLSPSLSRFLLLNTQQTTGVWDQRQTPSLVPNLVTLPHQNNFSCLNFVKDETNKSISVCLLVSNFQLVLDWQSEEGRGKEGTEGKIIFGACFKSREKLKTKSPLKTKRLLQITQTSQISCRNPIIETV